MSSYEIRNTIYRLQDAARKMENRREADLAIEDIARYIYSGRASIEFIERLAKCRPSCLLKRITPVWSCYDKVIQTTKSYLKYKD